MSNDSTQWSTQDQPPSSNEKSETTPKPEGVAEVIQYLSEEFDKVCQERHIVGAQEYGETKFLQPNTDLGKMMEEELADFANYARYLYIRVRMMGLNQAAAAPLPDQEPQVGASSFIPTGGQN